MNGSLSWNFHLGIECVADGWTTWHHYREEPHLLLTRNQLGNGLEINAQRVFSTNTGSISSGTVKKTTSPPCFSYSSGTHGIDTALFTKYRS